jgi:uncharacterized protein
MDNPQKIFVGFAGSSVIARGEIADVALICKDRIDSGEAHRIAVFDDETGRPIDIDFSGTKTKVLARLTAHPLVAPPDQKAGRQTGPGRPKLGVISREISLLPRHWDWLSEQRGGASAALRRMIDIERKSTSALEQGQRAIEAAHRFMWDIAGDQTGFENASRALFAQDFDAFDQHTAVWPTGIQEQLQRFIGRARAVGTEKSKKLSRKKSLTTSGRSKDAR